MIRRVLSIVLFCCTLMMGSVHATSDLQMGKITLIPYLPESYGQQVDLQLTNKLQLIVTQNRLAGRGFDNRFIICARLLPITVEQTATAPSKTAMHLSVTLYIGDGSNGTLFSSWETELRGIGNDKAQAYINALRKLSPANADIQEFIKKGINQIISYYNLMSNDIFAKARAEASSGKYDQAIITLLAIPSSCPSYEQAQEMISEYGIPAIESVNLGILNQARSVWSSTLNENGAAIVRDILCQITHPSSNIQEKAHELTNEMTEHLKQRQDHQWQLLMQQDEEHQKQWLKQTDEDLRKRDKALLKGDRNKRVADILSATKIEATWAKRPLLNYNVHWW